MLLPRKASVVGLDSRILVGLCPGKRSGGHHERVAHMFICPVCEESWDKTHDDRGLGDCPTLDLTSEEGVLLTDDLYDQLATSDQAISAFILKWRKLLSLAGHGVITRSEYLDELEGLVGEHFNDWL